MHRHPLTLDPPFPVNTRQPPHYMAMSAVTSGPRHHAGLLPPPPSSSSSPPPRRDMPGAQSWRGDGVLSPDSSRPRRLVCGGEAYEDVWFPLRPASPPSRSRHGTEGESRRRRRRRHHHHHHGPEPPTPPGSPPDAVEKAPPPRGFSSHLVPLNPGDPLFPGPPRDENTASASVTVRPPPRAPMIPRLRTPDDLDDLDNDEDAVSGCVGFCSCCGPADRSWRFGGGDRGEKMAVQLREARRHITRVSRAGVGRS